LVFYKTRIILLLSSHLCCLGGPFPSDLLSSFEQYDEMVESVPVLRPSNTLIQWLTQAFSPGIKLRVHEADHHHPSSVEVKNGWSSIMCCRGITLLHCTTQP